MASEARSVQLSTIPIGKIELEDRLFAISSPWGSIDKLSDSIRHYGVLTPVQLVSLPDGRFRIAHGFRRLRAATSLGLATVPALLADRAPAERLFLAALDQNLTSRPLSELEKARAVRNLRRHFDFPEERILDEVMPRLGLPGDRYQLDRCRRLATLPEHLQRGVDSTLDADLALRLAKRPADFHTFVANLIQTHRLGRNKQREAFELLDELAAQLRRGVRQVWRESGADEIERQAALSPADRWSKILQLLRRLRYPRLSQQQDRLRKARAALKIPAGIRLQIPAHFEGRKITVILTAESARDFREGVTALQAMASNEEIEKIFELL